VWLSRPTVPLARMSVADLSVEDLSGDPHPHLARVRESAPVAFVPALGGFLVTSRGAAVEVLHDPSTFTVDDPRFSTALVVGPSMLSTDGAEHVRHRQPFTGAFRPRQVTGRFGELVRAQVRRRVDALTSSASGEAELRSQLAGPVAAGVVAHTLGLDGDDDSTVGCLLEWYREIVASVAGVAEGRSVTVSGAEAMHELAATLRPHLNGAAGASPSVLADAAAAGELTADEVVSNAAVIMFGGIETTEAMILNALWFVLRAGWKPSRPDAIGEVADAVEESLRLEPAAAVVDRYATRDATIAEVSIPRGALVTVSLAGANRDPAEFPDPNVFDPTRPNLRRQLAFATGPHVCVGMDLARLEACVALAEVLTRFPTMQVASGNPSPTGLVFRKPARLDVTWTATAVRRD
jgi:cytochrome P450